MSEGGVFEKEVAGEDKGNQGQRKAREIGEILKRCKRGWSDGVVAQHVS